jgi:transcription termination factor Rho
MADEVSGVLKMIGKGAGVLRDPARSLLRGPKDVFVPPDIVRKYRLAEGASIEGAAKPGKQGPRLQEVTSVGGMDPEAFRDRIPFAQLTAIDPDRRFNLAASGDLSMRIVDLVAPIGKGTRGLIVSPPRAGKTTILEKLAQAIRADSPETRIVALLVDERPEEVTHFKRAVDAEVLASSSDHDTKQHVELAELTLAHVRVELECGRDVVVLADSLTRMGRAFNLIGRGQQGRTMSGGVDAGALEVPRRFFGLARNAEEGGSVTIIATALIDTGSKMDQLIFEEFKGTGNSELVLDRSLAEADIWPAIDIAKSGTRKEQNLYSDEEYRRIVAIRRALAGARPQEAMKSLIAKVSKFETNEEFLENIPAAT